ncbi:MAG: glycosyltransferase family 4 protein [Candidatus Thorarchaeota archaeon]|jgi:glycosyltransferase involved in cell wall biosynthesis
MKRKVILYLHPWSDLYGSSTYLYELVTRLDKNLYSPVVVLPQEGPLLDWLREKQIETVIRRMGIMNRKSSLLEIVLYFVNLFIGTISIMRLIIKRRVNLVHSNTCHIIEGCIAGKLLKKKIICHIHERNISPEAVRRILARIFLKLSDRIINVSEENQKHFFGNCNTDKFRIVSGGVDLKTFHRRLTGEKIRNEFGITDNAKIVGMVGRIAPWKGHRYFLKAAREVLESCSQTKFLVVGGIDTPRNQGYKNELVRIRHDLNLDGDVIFTGYRKDIPEVMAALDILVLPSSEPEPFGLALVEAMALCKPVVATAAGGPLRIITHNVNGLLVPPNDSGIMAHAIRELLQNEERMEMMGKGGRKHVEKHYTWVRTVEKMDSVYEELLASGTDG